MLVTDFEFAGQKASSWGLMPCAFSYSDTDTVSNGSKLTFTTAKPAKGDTWHFIGSQYNEQLTGTLEIMKKNCSGVYNNNFFTLEELRAIMRWLNRKDGYHRLVLTIDDMPGYSEIWFNAYINVSVVEMVGQPIGLSLEITTDKPYGYFAEQTSTINLADGMAVVYDISDEVGITYPVFTFRHQFDPEDFEGESLELIHSYHNEDGIVISKTTTIVDPGCDFVIDSKHRMIYQRNENQTPIDFTKYNFNFVWPTLVNTYDYNENIFDTGSSNCTFDVDITYSPIAKVGLI